MEVGQLIDWNKKEWDIGKVQVILLPIDIEEVLKIPICNTDYEDRLIWHYDSKGNFNVH